MAGNPDLKVLTWLWQQNPPRHDFNADKVNRWASMMRKHLTIPHTLACVTDTPEGLDPDIEVIPLPEEFRSVSVTKWTEASGAPQCYVRLNLWHPNAREMFGAEWFVSMDCDVIAIRNLDELFSDRSTDVRIFNGTGKGRPYNGGLVMLRAGSRPQVYEEFRKDPPGIAARARDLWVGSDQAVMSLILGKGERTFGEEDGVYYYSPRVMRLNGGFDRPPRNMRMLFFPGAIKPWNGEVAHKWMVDAWNGFEVGIQNRDIHAYDDPYGFGKAVAEAGARKGIRINLFKEHSRPVHQSRGSILRGLKAHPHDKRLKQLLEDYDKPPVWDGVALIGPGLTERAKEIMTARGVEMVTFEQLDPDAVVDRLLELATE